MQSHQVAAQVRERLGMEVQAVSLVRGRSRAAWSGHVWAVMTEHGHFWVVESGGIVELFRVAQAEDPILRSISCASPTDAVKRFLELHPEVRAATAASASQEGAISFTCRTCGIEVTLQRWTERASRELCKRCRHAERERLRYQTDPDYRARRLAHSAARYRRAATEGNGAATEDA
jgi:hypothetical protein